MQDVLYWNQFKRDFVIGKNSLLSATAHAATTCAVSTIQLFPRIEQFSQVYLKFVLFACVVKKSLVSNWINKSSEKDLKTFCYFINQYINFYHTLLTGIWFLLWCRLTECQRTILLVIVRLICLNFLLGWVTPYLRYCKFINQILHIHILISVHLNNTMLNEGTFNACEHAFYRK